MALSPLDQMRLGTANADMLAYFWYLVEHNASILVIGGPASGKTSLVNALAAFIPSEAKVASVESRRELRLPHKRWISRTREKKTENKYKENKYKEKSEAETAFSLSLSDLLKQSLREGHDYTILGEVGVGAGGATGKGEGQEACVFFHGMSSGHPSISTFKADSVDAMARSLFGKPIELPKALLRNLDVVAVMTNANVGGRLSRRIKEIDEVEGVDSRTGEVRKRTVFRWNQSRDMHEKIDESMKVTNMATSNRVKLEEAHEEIDRKKKFLTWMAGQNIKDSGKVAELLNLYSNALVGFRSHESDEAIEAIGTKTNQEKATASLLKLLGFKFLKEKENEKEKAKTDK